MTLDQARWIPGRTPAQVVERASPTFVYAFDGFDVSVRTHSVRDALLGLVGDFVGTGAPLRLRPILGLAYEIPGGATVACGVVFGGFSTSYRWWVLGRGRVLRLPHEAEEAPKVVDVTSDLSMCVCVGRAQQLSAVHSDGTHTTLDVTDRARDRRALSSDGARLCTAERGGIVREWDTRSGAVLATRDLGAPVRRVWWAGSRFDTELHAGA